MARNESEGSLEVFEVTPFEINDKLRQIVQRLDYLRGLSGQVVIHADLSVVGTLTVQRIDMTLLADEADLTDSTAGTANDTLQAVPDPADTPASVDALRDDLVANAIPAIRNNFADLAAKVNTILAALRVES